MQPFLTQYQQNSIPKLKELKSYPSDYLIPKVVKASINCGIGDAVGNSKTIGELSQLIAEITGQKPVQVKARKAISGFKIRQNMIIALKVTLRGKRMYDFIYKLSQISLPRTRDFRGLKPSSLTPNGDLNIGIRDSIIFPEIQSDNTNHGIQVTISSTAKTLEEATVLYESLGFVFGSQSELSTKKKTSKHHYKK